MKKTSQLIVIAFVSVITLFLYQNCGQEGKIFGDCSTNSCEEPRATALSIDTRFSPSVPENGQTLTIGKVTSQESAGTPITYNNIDIVGSCSTANFPRHLIYWNISCGFSDDCTALSSRQGVTYCVNGSYSLVRYIRGFNTAPSTFPRYQLNLEIVGLDEFDSAIPGGDDARLTFPLNPVNTIQAPKLYRFTDTNVTSITDPIVIVSDSTFPYQGLCDFQPTGQPSENLFSLKFRLPRSNVTVGGGLFYLDQTTTSAAISCINRDDPSIEPNIKQAAVNNGRTGVFNITYPSLTSYSIGDGFPCTNCIQRTFSRLYELEATQVDRVGNQTINVNSKQIYVFKSNDLFKGKGWTADTLYEIGSRINKMLSFTASPISLSSADISNLNTLITAQVQDAADDCLSSNTNCINKSETRSIRTFVLSKMSSYFETAKLFSPTDLSIQAHSTGNDFAVRLKNLLSNCGLSEDNDPVIGASGDTDTEKLALCFTRFFYYGLHNDSLEQTRNITQKGLNISGSCAFKDNSAAPEKYCAKIRELLLNTASAAANDIPILPNPVIPSKPELQYNNMIALKTKFLGSNTVSSVGSSDPGFKLYSSAIVQMLTNSILSEISRHTSGGVANSYFMKNVLDTVFSSYLPANITEQSKIDLYNELAPAEINYLNGANNFSAYSSRSERGSINSVGSITCSLNPDRSQCTNTAP